MFRLLLVIALVLVALHAPRGDAFTTYDDLRKQGYTTWGWGKDSGKLCKPGGGCRGPWESGSSATSSKKKSGIWLLDVAQGKTESRWNYMNKSQKAKGFIGKIGDWLGKNKTFRAVGDWLSQGKKVKDQTVNNAVSGFGR